MLSEQELNLLDRVPYVDPKKFVDSDDLIQPYSLNKKSDVYSIGVLLWEISSGQPPFKDELYDTCLMMQILQGYRETIVPDSPTDYSNLYIECWNDEPDNRPIMIQVVAKLGTIIKNVQTNNYKLISQNFCKTNISEIEPTTQNLNENIFEEDLSIVIDELVDLYFKELNKGKEEKVRKQFVFNYINNHKISLQEIYCWLLNNQNNSSNSIYLLGYFNNHGIGTNVNKQKAFELYQKAAGLENNVAQFELTTMYEDGEGVYKDYNKVFEITKKLADKKYLAGINRLGYCYYNGIGTNVNRQKACELFQKAAVLGNIIAQYNIALMYEYGYEVIKNIDLALYWYKKSAEQGEQDAKNKLKCLQVG
ncbi:hypothetical protein C1645_185166 [Glomus cerebriforme]|uniref:Protein kinase domain-containing protein n=1 Tax=Glomus cerebriforme TaxID=658196 RepID=A0A397T3S5_9GLOM|nr:hypothetical protein C1645_185166 [Glomus cerebriforme]